MQHPQETKLKTHWSTEEVIDLVRQKRNTLVKLYLEDEAVEACFKNVYGAESVSKIKIEFLKRDMRELLLAPVDLAYYSALILVLKDSHDSEVLNAPQFERLFAGQIETIFKKYIF